MFSVHPRLRGELFLAVLLELDPFGSSPLTRGTPKKMRELQCEFRFIPAYAGNSADNPSSDMRETVHPRLRGELMFNRRRECTKLGSSPLTRGTPV